MAQPDVTVEGTGFFRAHPFGRTLLNLFLVGLPRVHGGFFAMMFRANRTRTGSVTARFGGPEAASTKEGGTMPNEISKVGEPLCHGQQRFRSTGAGLSLSVAFVALLSACEGTLGPIDAVQPDEQGSGGGGNIFEPPDNDYLYQPGEFDPTIGYKVFPIPGFDLDGEPEYSRAIPLTNDQWEATVQSILNLPEPPSQANSFLNPVVGFTLFTNNEHVLTVSNEMRQAYQLAAAEIAEDQLADPGALSRIDAGMDAESFIRNFGRRAFRRPLTPDEVAGYTALFNVGAGLSGDQSEFEKGANLVIEGMLQSPHFLYRTELEPDGAPLTGFEKISKLSFWILGTAPTEALLDRAAAGEFDTPEGIATVVDEMLVDPRATEMIVDVYAQLFKFSRFRDILKEDPAWSPELNAELEESARRFFAYIYESDMGLVDILQSTQGFVGPLLAPFYGVTPPASMTMMDLGPERVGYFSQVPYLMLMGDGAHSDAIHRGVFLTFNVLCAELPDPPPILDPLPPHDPDRTDRQLLEAHTGIGTCGEGCHAGYINALGFAFENFDGLGRVRETDKGQPVDTKVAFPFGGDGASVMVAYDGAPELMPLIADNAQAHGCVAKSLMSYALSRDIVEADADLILGLTEVSQADGSLKQILRQLVVSPAFLSRPGAVQ